MDRDNVTFAAIDKSNMPYLEHWFSMPHVLEWWEDSHETLEDIKSGEYFKEYDVSSFIAAIDGQPIAYIQAWKPSANDEYPWQADLPKDARGIDLFIGPPEYLGKGIGPQIISAFIKKLRNEGAGSIFIDPDPNNSRAVRAYEKLGFKKIGFVKDVDGQSLLMKLEKEVEIS